MNSAPIAPNLLKGAVVGVDKFNPLASVVVFQYNPDSVRRELRARTGQDHGDEPGARAEAMRLHGPPQETITVTVEVDAADQALGGAANGLGIHAPLSALEMLLYPKSIFVLQHIAQIQAGVMGLIAPEAPMTLFVWGPTRVLPVRLTAMTITEEAHDNLLNPIRAKVELSMHVLSYYDLPHTHPGWSMFMVHQVAKEVLATTNTAWSIANAGQSLKIF